MLLCLTASVTGSRVAAATFLGGMPASPTVRQKCKILKNGINYVLGSPYSCVKHISDASMQLQTGRYK